jgi:hypothetical protein
MAFDSAHPIFQTTDTFQQLIDDLNHFGNNVDSDLSWIDSAIGDPTLLATAATQLVTAINELNDSIGAGSLNTVAQTLIGAVNEVEGVFDASAETIIATDFLVDASGDITLDADGANVILKDAGVQFGGLTNSSGNLIVKTGSATALTFGATNVTVAGTITLPAAGTGSIASTEISANTVHGAIDEVNERVPNVYNRTGTLLNP